MGCSGQCLCGAVSFEVAKVPETFGACHCTMCRTWGGGPWLAADCGTQVQFKGEDHISRYDSSQWAQRGFCSKCGTHLYYYLKQQKQFIISLGTIKDPGPLKFVDEVFVDEQPDYYCFANETKKLTGPEIFAMYAPPEQGKDA